MKVKIEIDRKENKGSYYDNRHEYSRIFHRLGLDFSKSVYYFPENCGVLKNTIKDDYGNVCGFIEITE